MILAHLGTKTVIPLVTTMAGQVTTAVTSAIEIAGMTLKAGDASFANNDKMISLDTAGRFVVGSKTHTLESVKFAGLGGLALGTYGTGRPFATIMPSAAQSKLSTGAGTVTSTNVQEFLGAAEYSRSDLPWTKASVVMIAMVVLIHA